MILILSVILILLVPYIAMQFTDEVDWSLLDFITAGILLFCVVFFCELIIRRVKIIRLKISLCIIIIFVFLLVWAELAVGIFN